MNAMKNPVKQPKIKIRPLSEGIGLGSLKTPVAQDHAGATGSEDRFMMGSVTSSVASSVASSVTSSVTSSATGLKIDSAVMRQAHAAYAPNSVASELRSRSSARIFVAFRRFVADAGADLFVGCFSVLVLAWSGILAWEAGSMGKVSPLDAFVTIQDFLTHMTISMWVLALLMMTALSRVFRMIFLRG